MMSATQFDGWPLWAGIVVLALSGCTTSSGAGTWLPSGLGVNVTSHSLAGVRLSTKGDVATIKVGGDTIVVEPHQAVLASGCVYLFPAGSKQLSIEHSRGKISLTADGVALTPVPRGNAVIANSAAAPPPDSD